MVNLSRKDMGKIKGIVKSPTLIAVVSIILCTVVGGICYYALLPIIGPSGSSNSSGRYLNYRNGTETKVFLIDSQLNYANNQNSVVMISGRIRNDYEREYYLAVTGDLYTSKGEKIEGSQSITSSPVKVFAVTQLPADGSGDFELNFKHEGRDIERYDIFLLALVETVHGLYPVVDVYPDSDSTNVPLATNISITFHRQPKIYEFKADPDIKVNKTLVEGVEFYNVRWTWLLTGPLRPQTTYTITIVYGQDTHPDGYPIPVKETTTWSFTTEST